MSNDIELWLAAYLKTAGAVAGTVHVREGEGLRLLSAVNIPPVVQQVVAYVPNGKGMAGIALDTKGVLYVADSQSNTSKVNPTVKRGVRIGPLADRRLPIGAWRDLTAAEVSSLKASSRPPRGAGASPPAASPR